MLALRQCLTWPRNHDGAAHKVAPFRGKLYAADIATEDFGEDKVLTSHMGVAYASGLSKNSTWGDPDAVIPIMKVNSTGLKSSASS